MLVLLVLCIAFCAAQDTMMTGGWAQQLGDKFKAILDGASDACNNKFISGPYIEGVFCGGLIPKEYLSLVDEKLGINLDFGEDSVWCSALACLYRAMGCPDPTYRIEARIIKKTGNLETCGSKIGLDEQRCATLAKFIASPPAAGKRSAEDEVEEAKAVARVAMKAWMPTEYAKLDFATIGEPTHDELSLVRKRQSGIVDQLQACSPLIALGLQVLGTQLNLPINITTILGPCGLVCEYALCGLNILCHTNAEPLLAKVNQERKSGVGGKMCGDLACADFIMAPKSMCEGIKCNPAAGQHDPGFYSATTNCMPPAKIKTPFRTNPNDCCETCTNECQGVPCTTTLAQCGKNQQWPACFDPQLTKADPYDCCPQCLDPCFLFKKQNEANIAAGKGDLCGGPAPTSCPAGQVVGPGRPGDCCFKCVSPCQGVSCATAPKSQADCPGKCDKFIARPEQPGQCIECCGRCEPAECQSDQISASLASLAVGAVLTAVASLF